MGKRIEQLEKQKRDIADTCQTLHDENSLITAQIIKLRGELKEAQGHKLLAIESVERAEKAEADAKGLTEECRSYSDKLLSYEVSLAVVVKALTWALDLIDMYDERQAKIDGVEQVYSAIHLTGKDKAREAIHNHNKGIHL